MTPPHSSNSPTDRDDFEAQLRHLIATARDNGVQFEGAYAIRSSQPDERDYQIEISEVISVP